MPSRKIKLAAEEAAKRGMSVGDLFEREGRRYEVTAIGHQFLLATPVDTSVEHVFYTLEDVTYPVPKVSAVQITISPKPGQNGIWVTTQHIMSDGSQVSAALSQFAGTMAEGVQEAVESALKPDSVLRPLLDQVNRSRR